MARGIHHFNRIIIIIIIMGSNPGLGFSSHPCRELHNPRPNHHVMYPMMYSEYVFKRAIGPKTALPIGSKHQSNMN